MPPKDPKSVAQLQAVNRYVPSITFATGDKNHTQEVVGTEATDGTEKGCVGVVRHYKMLNETGGAHTHSGGQIFGTMSRHAREKGRMQPPPTKIYTINDTFCLIWCPLWMGTYKFKNG
jgi:hypothetical protein